MALVSAASISMAASRSGGIKRSVYWHRSAGVSGVMAKRRNMSWRQRLCWRRHAHMCIVAYLKVCAASGVAGINSGGSIVCGVAVTA